MSIYDNEKQIKEGNEFAYKFLAWTFGLMILAMIILV